jgi:hypothetical protein
LTRSRLIQALVLAFPLALGVSACVDTVGTQSTTTAPAKTKSGQPPVGAGNMSAEQVRKKLQDQCVNDQGDFIGLNTQIKQGCECYAQNMSKAMGKDDLTFYSNYNVIPTLGNLKPDDAKRKCGLVPDADKPSRSRGKLPTPPS